MQGMIKRMMRRAVMVGVLGILPATAHGQAAPPPAAENAAAAPQTVPGAKVPVRQVVLFSSGVGYFEHFGSVTGSGSTELQFKTAQINDILKSLVLQDLDKGRISTITYPSQDPVSKTLRSFQVDITSNPSLAELLNQLRGARATIASGAERVTGTILGAEKKPRPVGKGPDAKVVEVWFVNMLTGGGAIRSVSLEDVREVILEDAKLQDELTRALQALASARDQDKKPVTINFQGQGERRIRIGYVIESPVWKTSYRLIMSGPAPAGGADAPKAGADAPKPADGGAAKPQAAGGAAQPGAGGALQGWAIVENQTDNDWEDVQLSLVSGRPISFIQDLYQPLYIPRPVVQPELYASLRPQTYEGGLNADKDLARWDNRAKEAEGREQLQRRGAFGPAAKSAPGAPAPDALAATPAPTAERGYANLGGIDAQASVSSIASAAKVGELFQYTVGAVTLPRQKSAMIPIITDPIEVERLSIYNRGVLPKNPLNGARVKNTTGKHLLNGPITVLDGGSYAGDARIDDVPPGQERLISYGIDQQITVQSQDQKHASSLLGGKIVKGVLHLSYRDTLSLEYVAENKGDKAKTLIIEHPRQGLPWKLVEPEKPHETTDALYRFKDTLDPAKPKKLVVQEQNVRLETIAILPMDVGQTGVFARTDQLPQAVRDAMVKAAELKGALVEVQRQIAEKQRQINTISQEQARLRDNMKTVPPGSDYYNRLLTKLNEQETTIEKLQKEVETLQKEMETKRKALEDYLSNLTVG